MNGLGISGCFGDGGTPYPIDDITEVENAVHEIMADDAPIGEHPDAQAPNLALAQLFGQFARMVRLLTWAVVAIAIVLVVKEMK